jgi:L-ascorbate metabolism protein UlaG (beta-lactamase superfamily)
MPAYTNLDGTVPPLRPDELIKWAVIDRLTGKRRRNDGGFVTPSRPNDGSALRSSSPHLTWIGHATYAMRLGGKLVLTDPVFSDRVHTKRRSVAPGVALEDMPRIDVVTVSHSHFDHMDFATLRRIGPDALYVVPKNNGDLLRALGLKNVVELGWFESMTEGGLEITLVPAQHWSMRTLWDRNRRLWGGFVYRGDGATAYHAGDTAWSEQVFRSIGERFPGIEWAMIPIGGYDPVWFMSPQHIGPEEAHRALDLVGGRNLCAMHWGTFKMTDEPAGEPPQRLLASLAAAGGQEERAWIFDVGETRMLGVR